MGFHSIFARSFVMRTRESVSNRTESEIPQTENNRGSKLTSLGAPPCPRSITVCSDLLSELPVIHKDRTLAPLCLGDLGIQQTTQNTHSPIQQPIKYTRKQVSTYPTNSPSSAAPLPHPHPLPSLPLPLPTLTRPTDKRRRRVMVVMGRSVARARR